MPSLKIIPTPWSRVKNNQLLGCRKVYYRIHRQGTLLQPEASSPEPPTGLQLFKIRFATSDHVIHPAVFQILCKITLHATFYAKGLSSPPKPDVGRPHHVGCQGLVYSVGYTHRYHLH
jgi:hypothetical protein